MSTDRLPVATKIRQRLWPTMSLALIAIIGAMTLAIPIGIYSAARQNGLFDSVISTVLYALYAVPSYVMAVPLILFIGVRWDLLPFQGMQSIDHDLLRRQWVEHVMLVLAKLQQYFAEAFGFLVSGSLFAGSSVRDGEALLMLKVSFQLGLKFAQVFVQHHRNRGRRVAMHVNQSIE